MSAFRTQMSLFPVRLPTVNSLRSRETLHFAPTCPAVMITVRLELAIWTVSGNFDVIFLQSTALNRSLHDVTPTRFLSRP